MPGPLPPRKTNLVAPPTPFWGRREELGALAAEGARLLSVLGPAGMGKTRLALEYGLQALGASEAPERPGGVGGPTEPQREATLRGAPRATEAPPQLIDPVGGPTEPQA